MHVDMHAHTCAYMDASKHAHICIYVYMHIQTHTHEYRCTCAHMCIHTDKCKHTHMCAHTYLYRDVHHHTWTYTYMYTHTHKIDIPRVTRKDNLTWKFHIKLQKLSLVSLCIKVSLMFWEALYPHTWPKPLSPSSSQSNLCGSQYKVSFW